MLVCTICLRETQMIMNFLVELLWDRTLVIANEVDFGDDIRWNILENKLAELHKVAFHKIEHSYEHSIYFGFLNHLQKKYILVMALDGTCWKTKLRK